MANDGFCEDAACGLPYHSLLLLGRVIYRDGALAANGKAKAEAACVLWRFGKRALRTQLGLDPSPFLVCVLGLVVFDGGCYSRCRGIEHVKVK